MNSFVVSCYFIEEQQQVSMLACVLLVSFNVIMLFSCSYRRATTSFTCSPSLGIHQRVGQSEGGAVHGGSIV